MKGTYIIVGESYATDGSLQKKAKKGNVVVVAFSKVNIKAVAVTMKTKYLNRTLS